MVRRTNSDEAAVVGGDDFCGCYPPAEGLLPGAGCQLVTGLSFSGNFGVIWW